MKTETELKQTWCPYAEVEERDLREDPTLTNCTGLACSQIVDCGPAVEKFDTRDFAEVDEVMTIKVAETLRPEGEGWIRSGFTWTRKTGDRHVYCGRNTGEALRYELGGLGFALERIGRLN